MPSQAFSFGKQVLALQFHLESDLRRLEQWLVGHSGELLAADIDLNALRRDAENHRKNIETLATAVFGGWLDQLG
ncbi:hypothetical protein [Deefgea tanakiae]|uniref:hypothetical protein n=1 Tax=Deefgea tanakiae TaxID=2865840 RepID=UPI002106C79B|nr:hypothetical protein [Deefgea tanakiae]